MLKAWFLGSYGTYIWKLSENLKFSIFHALKNKKNAIVRYV